MGGVSRAVHTTPDRRPEIWEKVPPRNKNFTGRDGLLQELRQNIGAITAVLPQAQTIHGLGGVGKTQLAIEYAWRYRSHYDFVWWISADQPLLVPSALAALAPSLDLPSAAVTGVPAAADAVRKALELGEPYRRWLIVFDNAEEPEHIKDLIPRGTGHVLITSRNPGWDEYGETLPIDVFTRAESREFLAKRLPRQIDDVLADRLAEKVGDLPLALEQAAAFQAQTGIPVEEYIQLLDEQTTRLLGVNRPQGYPRSMSAVWRLSVSGLEDRLPEAIALLRCCAFFGPEPIPRDLFRRNVGGAVPKLDQVLSDPILLNRILRELGRFALTRIDATTGTIQVHRLVQALLRDELPKTDQEELRHQVHLLLALGAPSRPESTDRWPVFEALLPHVQRSEVARCKAPAVRKFALDIVGYLSAAGNYPSALSFVEDFEVEWTKVDGPSHPDVLAARRLRGNILRALGRFGDAFTEDEATLRQMRDTLPPEAPDRLWMGRSFGASLRARGHFLPALELDQELEGDYLSVFGEGHPDLLRLRNSVGLDHALTSDYQSARAVLTENFMDQQSKTDEVGKASVLIAWNNLARTVRLCGDYTEARDLGEEAYEYGVRELGPDHPRTLLTAKDLSIALRRLAEHDAALELARDSHSRFQRLFTDRHPDTMAAALNLSNCLRAAGQLGEAFELVERVLPLYPDVYGETHPYTYGCQVNLALLHRLQGDAAEACRVDTAALEGLAGRVSRDHDFSLTCAINLTTDLVALGKLDEARELGHETYRRLEDRFGEQHYLTVCAGANHALDLRACGEVAEADRIRDEMVGRQQRAVRLGYPDALRVVEGVRVDCDFDPPPF
ncbi:hypothetical protein GCM10022226_20890 [Sphaerisporangium flaviroseum]|uniref:DUF7779 domain-containing protein n=1 Tax=Sphaerisporangium flaviroseum TaxID=509199 RepID=A0ABP7HSY0_9ACTN